MSRWLAGDPERLPKTRRGNPLYRFRGGAVYEVGTKDSGWQIRIPETFEFDLSVPSWARWALPTKKMLRSSGLHDYCRADPNFTLWFGNLAWVDSLKADGVREPWITVSWWAVRTNRRRA